MKITKTPKRLAEPMREVRQLLKQITEATDDELPDILDGISEWCWPRGDLHYWIQVLNRFDSILEETCRDYDLHKLQINEFTPLRKRILAAILKFSRLLIENCTSRKLYGSHEHLNNLLFTRDVDVLEATLRLLMRFAQQSTPMHPKPELLPAQEKLTTLAVTWAPRDHGLEMVDVAKEDATIPPELLHVKFQFYRRKAIDSGMTFTEVLSTHEGTQDDRASTSVSTPIRIRQRERMPSSTAGVNRFDTPVANSQSPQQHEGMATFELDQPSPVGSSAMDILADAIETHGIPSEDHFELYQRIRLALAMPNLAQRRQLLVCRLLAIACYAFLVPEHTAATQVFLYEPEIVARLAALANPQNNLPVEIISTSLYALDGLGRYRGRLHEVLSSLNASVNHGILLQLLRNISDDISAGPPTKCDPIVDAYFGLISFLSSTNVGSGLIVGAGLLQLLIKLIDTAKPDSYVIQRTVTRAIGLLDSVIYAYLPSFNIFCQAQGLEVFVRRIEEEIDRDIEAASAKMDFGEDAGPDRLFGQLTYGRAHLLRAYLQSISHMMMSTGTADGLRNLVDSSMLTSIKKIMEHRRVIGPQNLALAISIMATFVHNEPTSLGIIQEKKLPETFLAVVKEDIEAHFDVINAIPNAIGALCLNQAGLDIFSSEPIIDRLLSLLTSPRHIKVLADQDNVTMFGSSIDELVRHQPTMKPAVQEGLFKVLARIQEAGLAYEAPETDKAAAYRLSKVHTKSDKSEHHSGSSSRSGDITTSSTAHQGMALADVIMDDTEAYDTRSNNADDALKDVNDIASFMDITARFLEVLFQSTNLCKDFLRADGLEKLLKFYELPCLSYNFSTSFPADSMVHLLRFIAEINPNTVIAALLREAKLSLEETKPMWNQTEQVSTLCTLLRPASELEWETSNAKFRALIKLNARIQLLADVVPAFTYPGSKTPTTLLQVLNQTPSIMAGTRDVATLSDLGEFSRAWTWETVLFKSATHPTAKALRQQEYGKDTSNNKQYPGNNASLSTPLFDQKQKGEDSSTFGDFDANAPAVKNTVALRFIASQVKNNLNLFFTETNRVLLSRRTHDSSHKRFATLTATQIGAMLKESLVWKAYEKTSLSCDYLIVTITQAAKLLYEERPSQQMHAQTMVLSTFVRQGGLTQLLDIYTRFNDELDRQFEADGNVLKDEGGNHDILHVCGGLQRALDLLLRIASHGPLLDSPATQSLKSKEGVSKDSPEYFEPKAFLIHLRLTMIPFVRTTWNKKWLTSVNFSIARTVLRIIYRLAEGQGEVATASATPPSMSSASQNRTDSSARTMMLGGGHSAALMGLAQALGAPITEFGTGHGTSNRSRSAPVAEESRIRQLTDMGFPRRAARHALVRCNNNLSAATEYLLMHPEVVSTMQEGEAGTAGENATSEVVATEDETPTPATQGIVTASQATEGAEDGDEHRANTAPASTAASEGHQASGEDASPAGEAANSQGVDTPMIESGESKENSEKGKSISKEKETPAEDLPNLDLEHLKEERDNIMSTLLVRALELCDQFEALVFDVTSVMRIATQSYIAMDPLINLFTALQEAAPDSSGKKMQFVAVRLHLLALVFNDQPQALRSIVSRAQELVRPLLALVEESQKKPEETQTWTASLLLVLSAFLQTEDTIPESKMLDKDDRSNLEKPRIWITSLFGEELTALLDFTLQKLAHGSKLPRGDLLALYRFLVVVTRRPEQAAYLLEKDGLQILLRQFSVDIKEVSSCRPYAVLIMRHIVESNESLLRAAMEQEVRSFFCQSRTKVVDTASASKSLGPVILRQPDLFLDVMKDNVELVDYKAAQGQGVLKLPEADRSSGAQERPLTSGNAVSPDGPSAEAGGFMAPLERGPDESMELVPPSPTKQGGAAALDEQMLDVSTRKEAGTAPTSHPSLDAVMHFLISELLRSSRERSSKKDSNGFTKTGGDEANSSGKAGEAANASYFYICFLLQSLTELLSSYKACKVAFLNFTKKRQGQQQPQSGNTASTKKDKKSGSILHFFLSELVPLGFVQSREHEEMRRLMSISNWAMSTLVALGADAVPITTDVKEVSWEVVFSRKSVLDGIARAIKEATTQGTVATPGRAPEGIESRYGRLYALSDLCYRLLKARPNVSSTASSSARSMDDLTLHMAKTMLERNFVTVLTSALAEVDLNLPMVKSLIDRILKPLEYLTKVAIKMNKAERKGSKRRPEDEDQSMDESMDNDEQGEEDETARDEGEEAPDFYRNSSLGMHTGDLENNVGYDEDDDDEDDEDEDEEMEEGMEGVVYSDGDTDDSDDDDEDEEHIVEVMEEDDEDEGSTTDTDHSDDDAHDHDGIDDDEAGSWIDEDEEDGELDEDEDEESEELDFIIEGDAEDAQRLFQQAGRMFHSTGVEDGDVDGDGEGMRGPAQITYDIREVHEDEDEDDEEEGEWVNGEESDSESMLEGIFEHHGDLSMMTTPGMQETAPMDRFGATWTWTNNAPPGIRGGNGTRQGDEAAQQAGSNGTPADSGANTIISPFAFLRQRPMGNRLSRRRMDWGDALDVMAPRPTYLGEGRSAAWHESRGVTGGSGAVEDVASHPLLLQTPSQGELRTSTASRLGRHHGSRRNAGATRGENDGYHDWAQSLEGLMEGGAMQFLETLLQRQGGDGTGGVGGGRGGPAEAIHISLSSGGMPRLTVGAGPSGAGGGGWRSLGMEPRPAHRFGQSSSTPGTDDASSRLIADPVAVVQDFQPLPTLARWSEDLRLIAGAQADDRLRLMRAHIVNTLRPIYLTKLDEQKKKREQQEEERRKNRERDEAEKARKEEAPKDEATHNNQQDAASIARAAVSTAYQRRVNAETQSDTAHLTAQSTDTDVEMSEGGGPDSGTTAAEAVSAPQSEAPANLELDSLQQGLIELDAPATSTTAAADQVGQPAESTGTAQQSIDAVPAADSDAAATPITTTTITNVPTESATPRPRITTTINGNDVDITDSGIDPTFLEALPMDMREEVLNQHFRERRAAEAAAALAGTTDARSEPSNIEPEFLDALPPEIRAEVLAQETLNRTRRRFEERSANAREPRGPTDMDTAGFLASLNQDLRGSVLMEQDHRYPIPEELRPAMEALHGHPLQRRTASRPMRRGVAGALADGTPGTATGSGAAGAGATDGGAGLEQGKKDTSSAPRDAIQLLDKAGIAALVRLLFFPQMDSAQSGLREVLVNLSENSKSRAELLNLLLMILAEGASADANAVDKSYVNMSSRMNKAINSVQTPTRPSMRRNTSTPGGNTATATNSASASLFTPSTATPNAPNTGIQAPSVIAPLSRAGDEAPFLIASRSIETLVHLTSANEQAAYYFLKDDPSNANLMKWFKRSSNAKGKEREKATSNAPINILLVLLAKPSILGHAQLVDSLIALLHTVTRPLPSIIANRKKAEEERKKENVKADAEKPQVEEEKVATDADTTVPKAAVDSSTLTMMTTATTAELPMPAPQISDERMASVVKPLSISISSKGFQNTLAVASNLSTIDGAREVITSALRREADVASKSLMSELDDLLESLPIPVASKDDDQDHDSREDTSQGPTAVASTPQLVGQTDVIATQQISCPALTKLASPSSSQTVILRSLRALEWVLTRPKTTPASSSAVTATNGTSNPSHHHHHHHLHSHGFVNLI